MLILNGQLLEPGAPEVTLLNRSFKYGDGLFESIRVMEGKALFVEAHLNRLQRGMQALRFRFDASAWADRMHEEIARIISSNQILDHGRLRLHVYRAGPGAYQPVDMTPYFLLEGYSLKTDYFVSEVALSLTAFREIPLSYGMLSGLKLANSLPYILASIYAKENGFDDALLFCQGYLSESSSANLFLVKDQKLLTPPLTSACLDGIMRQQILQLATRLKLDCEARKLKEKDLLKADEIFLTNSIRGIIPVRQYQQYEWDAQHYALVPFLQKVFRQYLDEVVNPA